MPIEPSASVAIDRSAMDGPRRLATERVTFKERIAHFTWPWFAATMSTGGVAVVLYKTPNRFTGLDTIGKVFFLADIVLFVAFTVLIAIRFALAPSKIAPSIQHPAEGLFFGAYWVSVALILTGIDAYAVPSCGPWLVTALKVLFWLYCGAALLVAIGQYYVLFQNERLLLETAMPTWIFPIYPILVIGPLAGTLISSQPRESAANMWVGAVMLQGLGWTVALMMYAIYMQRLMTSTLPPPSTRPGMYVSVGPAGYTSAGLVALGVLAPTIMPDAVSSISPLADGIAVRGVGILAGTFVVLFAFWFFCISTIAVVEGALSRNTAPMSFTLTWWGFVFPNAGLTLAVFEMGSAYGSAAIDGIGSALTLMLVIMWLVTAGSHASAVWQGRILWPGRDEDKDEARSDWGETDFHA